jgi:hypothetical protein
MIRINDVITLRFLRAFPLEDFVNKNHGKKNVNFNEPPVPLLSSQINHRSSMNHALAQAYYS